MARSGQDYRGAKRRIRYTDCLKECPIDHEVGSSKVRGDEVAKFVIPAKAGIRKV